MGKFRRGDLVLKSNQLIKIAGTHLSTDGTRLIVNQPVKSEGIELASGSAITEISTSADSSSSVSLMTSDAIQTALDNKQVVFSEDANWNIIGGTGAGGSLTTGDSNFLAGVDAGSALTDETNMVMIGTSAGKDAAGGESSVVIGERAGFTATQIWGSVIIGKSAGSGGVGATTHQDVIFIGEAAGQYQNSSLYSIFIGDYAGCSDAGDTNDGQSNIGIGSSALRFIDTGDDNIAIGYRSLYNIDTVSDVIAIGTEAGYDITAQTYGSVYIGYQAARYLESGAGGNVVVGYQAGNGNNTDTINYEYAVIIGGQAGYFNEQSDSGVAIGYQAGYGKNGGTNNGFANVFVGREAGFSNDTAHGNIAIGYQALKSNEIESYNVVIGYEAGEDLTGASLGSNVLIGYQAGRYLEDGNGSNVVIGDSAGKGHASNSVNYNSCVLIGDAAGAQLEGGDQNVAIGVNALAATDSGSLNVVIGYYAGQGVGAVTKNSQNNVMIGAYAGWKIDTANYNVFVGRGTGLENATGDYNVYIGYTAGPSAGDLNQCIMIGSGTGQDLITQHNPSVCIGTSAAAHLETGNGANVVIGHEAGFSSDAGTRNYSTSVIIGHQAGYNLDNGNGNVFIGYRAGYSDSTSSNTLLIANNETEALIEGDFSAKTVTINGSLTVTDATSITLASTILTEKLGGGLLVNGEEIGGTTTVDETQFKAALTKDDANSSASVQSVLERVDKEFDRSSAEVNRFDIAQYGHKAMEGSYQIKNLGYESFQTAFEQDFSGDLGTIDNVAAPLSNKKIVTAHRGLQPDQGLDIYVIDATGTILASQLHYFAGSNVIPVQTGALTPDNRAVIEIRNNDIGDSYDRDIILVDEQANIVGQTEEHMEELIWCLLPDGDIWVASEYSEANEPYYTRFRLDTDSTALVRVMPWTKLQVPVGDIHEGDLCQYLGSGKILMKRRDRLDIVTVDGRFLHSVSQSSSDQGFRTALAFPGGNIIGFQDSDAGVYNYSLYDQELNVIDTFSVASIGTLNTAPDSSTILADGNYACINIYDNGFFLMIIDSDGTVIEQGLFEQGRVEPNFDKGIHPLPWGGFVCGHGDENTDVYKVTTFQSKGTKVDGQLYVGDEDYRNKDVYYITDNTADIVISIESYGGMIAFKGAIGLTLTVPSDTTDNLPIGFHCTVAALHTTDITFVADGGVTIISKNDALSLLEKGATARLYKVSSNEWLLEGDLT